jgi:hypothetical protein
MEQFHTEPQPLGCTTEFHASVADSFKSSSESFACSLHHINESCLCHSSIDKSNLGFAATSLETRYKIGDAMPYHDRSAFEPAPYTVEKGSQDAKFVLLFDPTFQGLGNGSVLNQLECAEKQLSLLRCFLACVPFVLVLFVSSEQCILFPEIARPLRSLPSLVRKLRCVCAIDSVFT